MSYFQWILYQPMRILVWLYRSIRGYISTVQDGTWDNSPVGIIIPLYVSMFISAMLVVWFNVPVWIIVIIGTLISSYYIYSREKKNG